MPGPNQGEQIHARTQERDAMFGRMAAMSVLRQPTPFAELSETTVGQASVQNKDGSARFNLIGGEPAGPVREGPDGHFSQAWVLPKTRAVGHGLLVGGTVTEYLAGGEVRREIEDVLRTYSNIGVGGATPDHQWRAAEHFRPFYAVEALTQAMERLIDERVRLSLRAAARPAADV